METEEDKNLCEHCSAPFDISDEKVIAINKFFDNLVKNSSKYSLYGLKKDEAYFLYKLAPKVLGESFSEI